MRVRSSLETSWLLPMEDGNGEEGGCMSVLDIRCAYCGAGPGQPCYRIEGPYKKAPAHKARKLRLPAPDGWNPPAPARSANGESSIAKDSREEHQQKEKSRG
jgi:hypothetical protein